MLDGRVFFVYTDHKPLTYSFLARPDRHSPREIRHLDFISQFTTDLRYVKGQDNVVADTLSRPDISALHTDTQINSSFFYSAFQDRRPSQSALQCTMHVYIIIT